MDVLFAKKDKSEKYDRQDSIRDLVQGQKRSKKDKKHKKEHRKEENKDAGKEGRKDNLINNILPLYVVKLMTVAVLCFSIKIILDKTAGYALIDENLTKILAQTTIVHLVLLGGVIIANKKGILKYVDEKNMILRSTGSVATILVAVYYHLNNDKKEEFKIEKNMNAYTSNMIYIGIYLTVQAIFDALNPYEQIKKLVDKMKEEK